MSESRSLIFEHAERLFLAHGFERVAMNDIATAVGVTKPALYYHFRDKKSLYLQVLMRGVEQLRADLDECQANGGSLRDRLGQLALRLVANPHADYRTTARTLAEHFSPEEQRTVFQAYHDRFVTPLAELFGQGIAQGELKAGTPSFQVHAFLSLLSMIVVLRRGVVPLDRREMVEETINLFLRE